MGILHHLMPISTANARNTRGLFPTGVKTERNMKCLHVTPSIRPTGTPCTISTAIPPPFGQAIFSSCRVRSGSRGDGSPEPAFEDQVRRAFANLREVLAAAGCSFDDVVDVTTFHTNPDEQIETVLAVRAEEIGAPPYPNWTAVGVNWLAGFDFEIKVIARIPSTTSSHAAANR
ncbi:enamine deaminase RidA (YjgF/YER057c/UK114 family) [Sinorhizobium medicae]